MGASGLALAAEDLQWGEGEKKVRGTSEVPRTKEGEDPQAAKQLPKISSLIVVGDDYATYRGQTIGTISRFAPYCAKVRALPIIAKSAII